MTSAFDSIGASLGAISHAPPTSGPPPTSTYIPATGDGGGKFSFAPDEIRAIVKDWLSLARQYETSFTDSDVLRRIEGPGREYASEMHASAASFSGSAYLDSLAGKRDYCYDQAQKFQNALSDYLGTERQNVRDLNRGGGNDAPPRSSVPPVSGPVTAEGI